MRQPLSFLAAVACLSLTVAANAQDNSRSHRRVAAYSSPSCSDSRGLVVCFDERSAPVKRAAAKASSGPLGKFAKLAGMFMGRVDAADIGNFKFRFKLELADGKDFLRE